MKLEQKKILVYGFYGIIIVVLIVLIVLIFKPHTTDTGTTKHQVSHQSAGGVTSKAGATKIANSSNNSSSQAKNTNGSSIENKGSNSKTLNNTGPGNVVTVFVFTSLVGSLFWRWRLIHRKLC
jgi:hypothetical protein